jgi:hypothetical protein
MDGLWELWSATLLAVEANAEPAVHRNNDKPIAVRRENCLDFTWFSRASDFGA